MARYFTHLQNHGGFQRDEDGRDYELDERAIRDGAKAAGSVLTEDLAAGRTPISITIMVERADASAVATIEVSARTDRPS